MRLRSHLTFGIVLFVFSVPLAFSLWSAFSGDTSGRFVHMMQTVLPGYMLTTVLTLVLSVALAAAMALVSAYFVTFYDLPFRGAIDTALVLPLALPPYLVAIVYRETLTGSGLSMQSVFGLAFVLAVTAYPFIYVLLRLSFRRQSAVFLETAAALGVARSTAIRRVIVPLALPALMLGCVLVAVVSASDFGAADMLSISTLTLAVRRILFSAFDEQLALKVALLSAVFPLALAGFYWWFVRGRSFVASINRPRPASRLQLSPGKAWQIALLCLIPPILGFFAPMIVLLGWAARTFSKVDLSSITINALNTALLSVGGAVIICVIGLWVTLATRRASRNGWRTATIGILSINLALPSIIIGVALLSLSGSGRDWGVIGWASDTALVLCVALVLKFSAFGYFSIESAFATVPARLEEAGLATGRSRGHVLRRILLPNSVGGIIIGATLGFLVIAKELTLSLTLHPFGFKSLSMSTYHLAKVDAYPEAAVLALCLIAICLYPVLSLHRWILR